MDKIAALEKTVSEITESWKNVTGKKMFGCPAYWVNGNVFALVWKHGRIGVKLPNDGQFDKLMSVAGSEPWKAGPMTMSQWVLVPEKFHSGKALAGWLKTAYELNETAAPKKKPAKKKPAVKKAKKKS